MGTFSQLTVRKFYTNVTDYFQVYNTGYKVKDTLNETILRDIFAKINTVIIIDKELVMTDDVKEFLELDVYAGLSVKTILFDMRSGITDKYSIKHKYTDSTHMYYFNFDSHIDLYDYSNKLKGLLGSEIDFISLSTLGEETEIDILKQILTKIK